MPLDANHFANVGEPVYIVIMHRGSTTILASRVRMKERTKVSVTRSQPKEMISCAGRRESC